MSLLRKLRAAASSTKRKKTKKTTTKKTTTKKKKTTTKTTTKKKKTTTSGTRTGRTAGLVTLVSGEGAGSGHIEQYSGPLTVRAISSKLTRLRAGGDRWAYVVVDGDRADSKEELDYMLRHLLKSLAP